jgi:small GTP-binding protein
MIRVDHVICKLEIWDTAGQERFSTITANYYRGAQGALRVYDVGQRDSFEQVQKWFDRAKQLGGEHLETILIGNKCDLQESDREVTTVEGELLAKELKIPFVETSALSGYNVEAAFVSMTSNIKKSVDRRGLTGVQGKGVKKAGGVKIGTGDAKMNTIDKCGCGR